MESRCSRCSEAKRKQARRCRVGEDAANETAVTSDDNEEANGKGCSVMYDTKVRARGRCWAGIAAEKLVSWGAERTKAP